MKLTLSILLKCAATLLCAAAVHESSLCNHATFDVVLPIHSYNALPSIIVSSVSAHVAVDAPHPGLWASEQSWRDYLLIDNFNRQMALTNRINDETTKQLAIQMIPIQRLLLETEQRIAINHKHRQQEKPRHYDSNDKNVSSSTIRSIRRSKSLTDLPALSDPIYSIRSNHHLNHNPNHSSRSVRPDSSRNEKQTKLSLHPRIRSVSPDQLLKSVQNTLRNSPEFQLEFLHTFIEWFRLEFMNWTLIECEKCFRSAKYMQRSITPIDSDFKCLNQISPYSIIIHID
jgi:hypothetical protein